MKKSNSFRKDRNEKSSEILNNLLDRVPKEEGSLSHEGIFGAVHDI